MKKLLSKIQRKLRYRIVHVFLKTSFYFLIYRSFWHYKLGFGKRQLVKQKSYFTAVPNPDAGIGHQMANWIAGYWFASIFELEHAHIPFSNQKWEAFLGFSSSVSVKKLVDEQGYIKVRIPMFNEYNIQHLKLIKKIINSYNNSKVVFVAEQDQSYRDQYGVIDALKKMFYKARSRENDKLIYLDNYFNVAVHIRRGDIIEESNSKSPNLLMRFQDNIYFEKVLTQVLENIGTTKPIAIYLFSQGERKDFKAFEKFTNIHFCLDMNASDSFLHMIYADLLITSKSSFSYKPALLNNGIKVCPRNFWHSYPTTRDWVLADDDGNFNAYQLNSNE